MRLITILSIIAVFQGCIGDDILEDRVDPTIQILSNFISLPQDTSIQLEYRYLDYVGRERNINPLWSTSNEEIISVDQLGKITTHEKGIATITASYITLEENIELQSSITIEVDEKVEVNPTVKSGTIRTTSSYDLSGDFVINTTDDGILIEIADNYIASSSLPGLYLYLTNNPNTTKDALEVGRVQVFRGKHSYEVKGVNLNEYSHLLYFCKPFNVKVGDGAIN